MRRRIIYITALAFFACAVFCLAACGRGGEDKINVPGPVHPMENGDYGSDITQTGGNQNISNIVTRPYIPEVRPGLEGIPITWGFNPQLHGGHGVYDEIDWKHVINTRSIYEETDIQAFLSRYFNVQLEGLVVSDTPVILYEAYEGITGAWWRPRETVVSFDRANIYLANPREVYVTEARRTIPEDMIRRYAPNYAALLDRENGWHISRAPNGEQAALNTFDASRRDLGMFSVYRLEWLEGLDIPLPGANEMIQLAEGVYFTPQSFTLNEFAWIMESFSAAAPNPSGNVPQSRIWNDGILERAYERGWGMEINTYGDFLHSLLPVLGMFGVNMSIMEEDGEALPFYATRAYREALLFLEDLAARDVILVYESQDPIHVFINDFVRVGWSPVPARDLFNIINAAHRADPARRFLITPPEIGDAGNRGVGLHPSYSAFNPDGLAWVIDMETNDDTLSRILNIFDALAFDPEIFTVSTYGFYSESPYFRTAVRNGRSRQFYTGERPRIEWSGDPFDSIVRFRQPPRFEYREGLFTAGIFDGVTFPAHLYGEFPAVTAFAQSGAGRRLNLPAARTDADNIFARERAFLDEAHWEALMSPRITVITTRYMSEIVTIEFFKGVVFAYLHDVITGNSNVAQTWDEYINALNANGLQEYIELFSRYTPAERQHNG